jgi:hypothetical protein
MRSEGFWLLARLSEGACPQRPVTEPKRSQNAKNTVTSAGAAGARYRIDGNALKILLTRKDESGHTDPTRHGVLS